MWAIQMLLPIHYKTLVDVFGGSGIITLNTAVPKGCLQIYNDLNHDLYNLLFCVKHRPMALTKELSFLPINARDEFDVLRRQLQGEDFTQLYLTTYITYEENVLPITGGDFALTFLDGTQSGYDVHYATAAALMFRYYGIPARYVEGYLVTKDDAAHMKSGQTLDVGGNRAHAWVEYYQDGLGWLPFEATPTYFSAMEKAEQYQNISGLVGQAPLDYTADNLDDAELENPAAEALREFWLKHRLTILLTLAVLLAAGMVGLLIGWLIFERRRTKKRKEGFFGADAAASIDAIFRYMMDVLRARGMAAKNCPPADYVSYMDEDLREEYLAAAKLWQEARFRGKPMQELQRRRVLRLKDEIWERTWHSASLKERLRLKYVEFL